MTTHQTGTREQWLAARLKLLDAEKALTRQSDELAQRRQELPWVRVDKVYRFDTDEGMASLAEIFKGRSQVCAQSERPYSKTWRHPNWRDGWGSGCPDRLWPSSPTRAGYPGRSPG